MEEAAVRKDRERYPRVVAAVQQHQERGQRHLGDVELGETQLTPEDVRRLQFARSQIDTLDWAQVVQDTSDARIA
ncbi:hypothetical protein [Blastococcus brunescens]|uniref:Uncharacterized protein n=1 Tax=Blastococcus brunescens TaxID=1564165 RepID=A0ABZ1AYC7_9ACTN|nr:hypothetical protein [Blastococcus sp. BMG 8361]WRL63564.1 hypothetical protein U6N30_28415 [Blastococcus sp. BMG 8361]